jgi:hypothetical protein
LKQLAHYTFDFTERLPDERTPGNQHQINAGSQLGMQLANCFSQQTPHPIALYRFS